MAFIFGQLNLLICMVSQTRIGLEIRMIDVPLVPMLFFLAQIPYPEAQGNRRRLLVPLLKQNIGPSPLVLPNSHGSNLFFKNLVFLYSQPQYSTVIILEQRTSVQIPYFTLE